MYMNSGWEFLDPVLNYSVTLSAAFLSLASILLLKSSSQIPCLTLKLWRQPLLTLNSDKPSIFPTNIFLLFHIQWDQRDCQWVPIDCSCRNHVETASSSSLFPEVLIIFWMRFHLHVPKTEMTKNRRTIFLYIGNNGCVIKSFSQLFARCSFVWVFNNFHPITHATQHIFF